MKGHEEEVVKSTCRMCHGVCGVLVHIQDGKVVEITGDPDCPTSRGFICSKGRASVELLYHPDRLKYPLKRTGKRGENKWQRISWDEAMDTIAERFLNIQQEFGAESIVPVIGTGRPHLPLFQRSANCLGTPNFLTIINNCYFPRIIASSMTCGRFPVCDYYGFGGIYPKRELPVMLRTAWPEKKTYWKFAARGACQDIFFHLTLNTARGWGMTDKLRMNSLSKRRRACVREKEF